MIKSITCEEDLDPALQAIPRDEVDQSEGDEGRGKDQQGGEY